MRFNLSLLLIPFFICQSTFGQDRVVPLNRDIYRQYETFLNRNKIPFHASIKPFIISDEERTTLFKTFSRTPPETESFIEKRNGSLFWKKVSRDHLIDINEDGLVLKIDPLFNFEYGYDTWKSKNTFCNTRGIRLAGEIGKKLYFESNFYENQATFVNYFHNLIHDSLRIVPGQGRVRVFKKNGFDYTSASGFISYTPSKYFNFQFGHGKNFFGDGYRSLLLSDNAIDYPFFKITTSVWKMKYVNLFTQFQDIREQISYTLGFPRKYATFHYLSILFGRKLNVGIFEGVVWQAADSLGKRGFDINYLNPVIFYHPIQFSLGHPDNSMLGLNMSYKFCRYFNFYSQVAFDDFNFAKYKEGSGFFQNKVALQLGCKVNDLLTDNLNIQFEYNQVRPYMYAHKTTLQSYTHINQPLAHPLGANFKERVIFINYHRKRIGIENKLVYATYGADSANSHFGHDIYRSDYDAALFSFGNFIGQGVKTVLLINDVKLFYLINPVTNLKIEAGYFARSLDSNIEEQFTNLFYIGIRTNLTNKYYDF